MKGDRQVAGLWCHEVLDKLSDYIDGELPAAERAQLEQHLKGCDACTRFGGQFAATVTQLREHLLKDPAVPDGFRERLRKALKPPGG